MWRINAQRDCQLLPFAFSISFKVLRFTRHVKKFFRSFCRCRKVIIRRMWKTGSGRQGVCECLHHATLKRRRLIWLWRHRITCREALNEEVCDNFYGRSWACIRNIIIEKVLKCSSQTATKGRETFRLQTISFLSNSFKQNTIYKVKPFYHNFPPCFFLQNITNVTIFIWSSRWQSAFFFVSLSSLVASSFKSSKTMPKTRPKTNQSSTSQTRVRRQSPKAFRATTFATWRAVISISQLPWAWTIFRWKMR